MTFIRWSDEEHVQAYTQDDEYDVVEFDETIKPQDYEPGKYLFVDGQFVPNGDFVPDTTVKKALEDMNANINGLDQKITEKSSELQGNIDNVSSTAAQRADEIEEALCDVDETYGAKIDELENAIHDLTPEA